MDHQHMHRHGIAADGRSVSEILSDARDLQARHAPRVLDAVASWIRDRFAHPAAGRSAPVARRLVVH